MTKIRYLPGLEALQDFSFKFMTSVQCEFCLVSISLQT